MEFKYSLGMYEKALPDSMPLEQKMEYAKKCGFDHIELCVDLNEERAARLKWSREERIYWRNMIEKTGVPFTSFSLSLLRKTPLGLLDEEKNREAFYVFEEGCRLAVDLGSRVMLINGYDVYGEESTPETRKRFFENYGKCAEIASRYGVLCGVENAEMPFCQTIGDAVKICSTAGSPYMKVYGDIANQSLALDFDTDRAVEDMMAGKGEVIALHLKDAIPGEYRYKEYGTGKVDFERCVAAAKKMGVRLFTAEIFCDENKDPVENAAAVAGFLRSYLDKE